MYQLNSAPVEVSFRATWRQLARVRVTRNVWYLGATSLLTDVSSEMVTSVLPVYLFLHLRMTPLAFGGIDGVYQGAAAVVRTGAGFVADRWRQYKLVAALGYALSALSRLGLMTFGAGWSIVGVLAVDRLGKGIRTAPRDTLIAESVAREHLGTAFGVHRSLDAAGAMLGPLVAFALLALLPGRFDVVFSTSLWIAIVGLAVLLLFVQPAPRVATGDPAPVLSWRAAVGLAAQPGFRSVLIAATGLSAGTVSDAFLYLTAQQHGGLEATLLPLFYVGTPLCYFLLAGPVGVLADRIGRGVVFVGGHAVLLVLYGVLIATGLSRIGPLACVVLLGGFYAATDGVVAALASARLPAAVRGTGLAVLATSASLARVFASFAFGLIWTWHGTGAALSLFALALAAGILVASRQLAARTMESRRDTAADDEH